MTQQQFEEEIRRLSVEERIALIEAITHSLREDLELRKNDASVNSAESSETASQDRGENGVSLSQRLYGILKFDGDPPTDEELKNHYADYLTEKYS
jgi:hypothetical protein